MELKGGEGVGEEEGSVKKMRRRKKEKKNEASVEVKKWRFFEALIMRFDEFRMNYNRIK